jgi:hypothetical protein
VESAFGLLSQRVDHPMSEVTPQPSILRAGDTWYWLVTLADYPADAWTLNYYLRGSQDISFAGTAEGQSHKINVAATTTAGYTPGTYGWQAVSKHKTDGRVFLIGEGTLEVRPNLETVTGTYDGRSNTKKILDVVTACLLGTATKEEARMQIYGRSLERRTLDELENLKARYEALYRTEQIREGQQPPSPVLVKFAD